MSYSICHIKRLIHRFKEEHTAISKAKRDILRQKNDIFPSFLPELDIKLTKF